MIYIAGILMPSSKIVWQLMPMGIYDKDGITITLPTGRGLSQREALESLIYALPNIDGQWLAFINKQWTLDLNKMMIEFGPHIQDLLDKWKTSILPDGFEVADRAEAHSTFEIQDFSGIISIMPDFESNIKEVTLDGKVKTESYVRFIITKDLVMESQSKKIFLSHKSLDKLKVRNYKKVLETLGYDPWIDEDAMTAGTVLERGIHDGFKQSCAVVFFLTENFKDGGYLSTEIEYAIAEKRSKKERFSIITIVFQEDNKQIVIPDLLQRFVYKNVKDDLDGLNEIAKALPISLGTPIFKSGL